MTRTLSTVEAGRLLGLSADSVRRRIADGRIPAVRIGGLWRVRLDLLGGAA